MTKHKMLWIDQDGNRFWARTVKELRAQIGNGGCRVSKQYCDMKDGTTWHTGYVIGDRWLTGWIPMRKSLI